MKFTVEIDIKGAALTEDTGAELARMLREIADKVKDGVSEGIFHAIRDYNGNTYGQWGTR